MNHRDKIFNAAIAIAKEGGVESIHTREISKRSGIKAGNIPYFYKGTVNEIKADVLEWGKANGLGEVFTNPLLLNRKRATPKIRREQILAVIMEMTTEDHYLNLTRSQIAMAAGISDSLVGSVFGTMAKLRRDIVRYAIQHDVDRVIAQALVSGDSRVSKLEPSVKDRALANFAA